MSTVPEAPERSGWRAVQAGTHPWATPVSNMGHAVASIARRWHQDRLLPRSRLAPRAVWRQVRGVRQHAQPAHVRDVRPRRLLRVAARPCEEPRRHEEAPGDHRDADRPRLHLVLHREHVRPMIPATTDALDAATALVAAARAGRRDPEAERRLAALDPTALAAALTDPANRLAFWRNVRARDRRRHPGGRRGRSIRRVGILPSGRHDPRLAGAGRSAASSADARSS